MIETNASRWLRTAVLLTLVLALASVSSDAGAIDPLRIKANDVLRIDVLNRPEYSLDQVVVRDDGRLAYFFLGEIDAAGLTFEELRLKIQQGVRQHFIESEVIVSPIPRQNEVYVGGEVRLPGRYPFPEDSVSLEAAIILGGGHVPESANLSGVVHLVRGSEPRRHDLSVPFRDQVQVRAGDVIYVPEMTRIHISGNVGEPGVFHFQGPVSIGHALARAGGTLDDKGDLARVVVVRAAGPSESIDVGEEFWAQASEDQPELRHGDVLFIPNAYKVEEISILGHVYDPGVFRVRGPVSLGRALALAGGAIMNEAATSRLRITRLDGQHEVVSLHEDDGRTLLFPGETLTVPARFQINWSLAVSFISTAAVLVSLFTR